MRLAAILALIAALSLAACEPRFDSARWAAERGNYDGENARGVMVAHLADAGIKPGATRAQVRALLGEPDARDPGGDIYYLGRSAVGPSFETYHIAYSTAGVVTVLQLERS